MRLSPSRRAAIASWLVLASVLLWENRGIFAAPLYEQGDDAANALSIDRARHGAEIYGNYSRFNFRHPGPAFAYAYAAGEALFLDVLHVVPARHNAHLLTGILLQAAFLALAVGVAASHSGRPSRAAWLLTGAALVHFAFVPGAFDQVWPPLALIMPFALFLVSAASVAAGRTRHAPWLALSAAFLLHGHVAQALFVGVVGLLVLACLAWRRLNGAPAPLPAPAQLAAIGLVAALTALPWAIDASRGRQSNFFDIWLHIKSSANDPLRPGWAAAVADTASYLCYCMRQEDWFSPGAAAGIWPFLQAYGLGALASLAGLAGCGLALWRGRSGTLPAAAFQRALAGVCLVATLLCVVWAHRQDGGITYFNSLFIFGLMMAAWVIPILAVAQEAPPGIMAAMAVALAVAVGATAGRYRVAQDMGAEPLGAEAQLKVARSLSGDDHPERAKLLLFSHNEWGEAVTVAAALNRLGIRSYVPQSDYGTWSRMFGADHVIGSIEQARALGPFTWWRPARAGAAGARLADDLRDSFPAGGPSALPFAFDLVRPAESFGLSAPEDAGTWTESKVVFMRLWSEPASRDVRLCFRASALPLAHGEFQRVRLMVNGTVLPEIQVTRLSDYSARVPRQAWNGGTPAGLVEIAWGLPDSARLAAQPRARATDARLLGICLHTLSFELEGPVPASPAARTP